MDEGTLLTDTQLGELKKVASGESRPSFTDLARALADALGHIAALEAWRADMLQALAEGLDYTPTAEGAAGALRGLIEDEEAAEQRAVTAESERDAAQQSGALLAVTLREVTKALGDEGSETPIALAERLAARVAELEAERKRLHLRVCAGEQNLRSANQTVLYANENGARAAAERDRAEARATAAEAALWKAEREIQKRLECGPWSPEGEAHLNALLSIIQPAALAVSRKVQPTTAPGLLEAVGDAVYQIRQMLMTGGPRRDDAPTSVVLPRSVWQAILAAYDGKAPGGEQ